MKHALVSDRIAIDTVLNKYTAHIPLYRQSALLERDCDITITRATMDGWVEYFPYRRDRAAELCVAFL